VVGIRVNHDIVGVPEPTIGIVVIVRRDAEVKVAKPEAISCAALKPIDVATADVTREMSMLPRLIQMVMGIVWTGIVTNPLIVVCVDVRGLGMSWLVAIAWMLAALLSAAVPASAGRGNGSSRWCSCGRRAVSRNVSLADRGRSLLRAGGGSRLSLLLLLLLLFGLGWPLLGKSGS